jgi:hypothetical protein
MSNSENATYPGREVDKLFENLRERWYPPNSDTQASFTRLADRFDKLMQRLEHDRDLWGLDSEFYPDVDRFKPHKGSEARQASLEDAGHFTVEERGQDRSKFYFCLSLIQLMEDVYLDLKLEDNYDHPDNQGWLNTFQRWTGSRTLQHVWMHNASLYGTRFRSFAQDRFGLTIGTTDVDEDTRLKSDKLRIFAITLARSGERFPVGFMLVSEDGPESPRKRKLVYIWIEKYMRRMGIATRAALMLANDDRFEKLKPFIAGDPWSILKDQLPADTKDDKTGGTIGNAKDHWDQPNPDAVRALRTIVEQQRTDKLPQETDGTPGTQGNH